MANLSIKETALSRFYDNLAYKPWCGDDKTAQLVRPRPSAIKKSYIAPNPPAMTHWLVFDLDHENCMIWDDKGLPCPNLIVQNPGNGKSHLYYAIESVCVSDKARKKPIYFMKAIARGLAMALDADTEYTGRIAKNPLSPAWRVSEMHSHVYSLKELGEYVEPLSKPFVRTLGDYASESRNCNLFHPLRFWSYRHLKEYKHHQNEAAWYAATLHQALSMATIEPDFTYNEIKNTAKSVAKWTWMNYTGDGKDRGVMKLAGTDISLEAKQRLAARRTHELRTNATEKRVLAAIRTLHNGIGKMPSKKSVAERIGLSRQQISRRYAHLFHDDYLKVDKKLEGLQNTKGVAFGVNQVAAGFKGSAYLVGELGLEPQEMLRRVRSINPSCRMGAKEVGD